jgi:hypothetical protein
MTPTEETYTALKGAYDAFNKRLFDETLPGCLFTLQREKRTSGYFSSNRFGQKDGSVADEIAVNPEYFAITPLVETLQTVAHEMCHQWQQHFGKPGRGRYHNGQWASKMEAIGLMPSSTGSPGGERVGDRMSDYPVEGGRFQKVVNELVGQGFDIPWYDRFTPQAPLYASENSPITGFEPKALTIATSEGFTTISDGNISTTVSRSNRIKYICRGCDVSVWGKPGLEEVLGCMKCKFPFNAEIQQIESKQ